MDHRDAAQARGSWFESFDDNTMTASAILWLDDSGDAEETRDVKCHFELCPTCDGKGKHVHPAIDAHGISSEEFAEDRQFFDDYRRGVYDVPCYECHGRRVIPVPNAAHIRFTLQRMREVRDRWIAEEEAERRMGA